jgi:alpha-beta hydrolase superfamily lysophospholipase
MHCQVPRIDFYSARDGRRLAARVWNSIEPPRARLVFLHGISSHGGWYEHSGCYLNGAGFEVHFLDRRGSGLNAEERGDVANYETWIGDVVAYLELLASHRPVILGGISWGGKLAAAVAGCHPELMHGLALLCPGLYSYFDPSILQRLALAAPLPQRTQDKRVGIPLRPASLFTETPHWQKYVEHDPLSLRDVTLRFARADRQLTRFARKTAPFIHMPTLLMLAGRDQIINNDRCRAYLARTAAVRKTLIEYPNSVHTLEFEPDPSQYFADLANWIGQVIA